MKVVIQDRTGRCLLLRRSRSSTGNPGKWEFPGGKVEEGEDFAAGLVREVAEETGLIISLERVVGAAESELPTRKVAYLILQGRVESGNVRLSKEHEDYDWVTKSELGAVDIAPQFLSFAQAYANEDSTQSGSD
jgi:8-oxo-dGTP diphosphatase